MFLFFHPAGFWARWREDRKRRKCHLCLYGINLDLEKALWYCMIYKKYKERSLKFCLVNVGDKKLTSHNGRKGGKIEYEGHISDS